MSYGKTAFMTLIGSSFILGLLGYTSIGGSVLNSLFGGSGIGTFVGISAVIVAFLVTARAAAGGEALTSTATGSSFSVLYTIPIAIAFVVVAILFVPLTWVNEVSLPPEIKSFIYMFYGGLILMSVIDLILGRDW